jgi:predicted enzyme related to lactoylglutathione lyase
MTQHAAGMFCWCQLGTSDPQGAKKFYSGLFGWGLEDTTISGQIITLLKKDGREIGALYGLMKEEREQRIAPNWMPFVAVENADRTSKLIQQGGGKTQVEPMDILDHGRMAVCEDPTTAVFALWQAGRQIGAAIVNEVGSMCWNELITDDAAKAAAFYRQVFGWTEEKMQGLKGEYTIFKKDGASAGGMMQATAEMKLTHPYWLVYFAVENCDRSVAQVRQLGGRAMLEPTDIPDIGRISVLTDPQGAYFAVIAPKPGQKM